MRRPTIKDVAERAGVSKSLAALVFSSESGVSQERRDRVLAAAADLGYTPNQWARSLRAGLGNFVGILVNDLHNPLLTEIADLTRMALLEKGQPSFVSAVVISDKQGKRFLEPSSIHDLLDLRPKGLVVIGGLPDLKPFKSVPPEVPIVIATSQAKGLPQAIVVRSDDDKGIQLVVGHMVSLGHKRIAYVGPDDSPNSVYRTQAYKKWMRENDLGDYTMVQRAERNESGGYTAAKLLLQEDDPPTAIICFNDNIAFGVQSALVEHRANGMPAVAVSGYDNTYFADLARISLTSVEQEKHAIATKVSELLTDSEMAEKYRGSEIKLLPRLVIRASTTSPD